MESDKKLHIKEQINLSIKVVLRTLKIVWAVDKRLFIASIFSMIIPGIIPFVNAYIYKLLIDRVVEIVNGVSTDITLLYLLLGARITSYFIQDVAFRTQDFVFRLLYTKMPIYLTQTILGKVSSLDIHYFENSKFRDLLEKVRESFEYRPQNMVQFIFYGLQSFIQVTVAFIAIAHLDWRLMFIVALISIPEFINQANQTKLSWGLWGSNAPMRKKYWYLADLLQNYQTIKEIKIFKLAERFLYEIKHIQQKFYNENSLLARKFYRKDILFNSFSSIVLIGVEFYVIFQVLSRKLTIGDIGFYTGVVNNFQNGLSGLFSNVNRVFENSLYMQDMFQIIDSKPIIQTRKNSTKLKLTQAPKIEFKDVTFSYPDTEGYVLKDFSLTINPGEKIAFVGENGAGKSTIIKLLARFYDVNKGKILVNGIDLRDLDLEDWYSSLGVLFQDFNKYEHSAKENIWFGNINNSLKITDIVKAANSSGAESVIKKFDKGYEQMLGRTFEGGIELSTGQWQKIALARGFFRNAPVLILDEPTSAIDAKAESEIFNRVEKLSRDKTVIIISHRFSTVRNADKIYVIDNGKIAESGTHKELMKLNGQYSTLFNLQAKGYK